MHLPWQSMSNKVNHAWHSGLQDCSLPGRLSPAVAPVFLGIFHPIQGVPAFMAGPHTHAKHWFPGQQGNLR